MNFESREEYYSNHRQVLQTEFLRTKEDLKTTCVGFFSDSRHLANHFAWLTSSAPLNRKIEENLFKQMEHLLKVISFKDRSVQYEDEQKRIALCCQLEFNGSRTYRDIETIRQGCVILDKGMESYFVVHITQFALVFQVNLQI